MRSILLRPILTLACLILLGACSGESTPDSTTNPDLLPQRGGRLTVAVSGEPDALNPLTRTTAIGGDILGICNLGLAYMDTDLVFRPSASTGWEFSEDQLTLRYALRTDLKWSDGEPFDSADVVASYELYSNPAVASPRASNFKDIVACEADGPHAVIFRFSQISRDQIFNSSFSMVPEHVVANLDPAQARSWSFNRKPTTLGQFRIREWKAGEQIVLERNPFWPGEGAWLDEVVLRVVPEESSRLLQLAGGEVDMMESLPYPEIGRLREGNPELKLYELDGRNFGYMAYNCRRPALADTRVRRAMSLAYDRRAIIDGLMYGHADLIATPIPPLLAWAHHDGLKPHERDLEAARQLLAEAGFADSDNDGVVEKDGIPLRLSLKTRTGDPVREYGAVILQRNLADIGIEAEISMRELGAVLEEIREGDFDLYLGKFRARLSVDPTNTFGTGGSFNYGGWSNEEADRLIQEGLALASRDDARPVWRRFQEILHEEQPWSLLYLEKPVVGLHERFRDATPHALSQYEALEKWWEARPVEPTATP